MPAVSHEEVLARDLAERKPFSSTGKGYRDALIWESVLEHLPLEPTDGLVVFVTRNSTDFATKDGSLHPALAAEAANKGGEVVRVESLKAAIELLRADAEQELTALLGGARLDVGETDLTVAITGAVVAATERLTGTILADDHHATPTTGLEVAIPEEMESAEITGVAPRPETLVLDVYDRYAGDTLAISVSLDATLRVEGFVYKADYYTGLEEEEELELVDADWNEHIMLVQLEREVRLQFNVLTVANEVEDITFDTAEPA